MVEGLQVIRSPLFPSHDQSAVHRLANYGSFALTTSLLGQATMRSADVVVVYSSPATAALPAMLASSAWGTPFVIIVQDLWPETVMQSPMSPSGRSRALLRQALGHFDRVSNSMAGRILVTSPGMKGALVERGVPEAKVSTMFNWAHDDDSLEGAKTGELRRRIGIGDSELLFLYGGNMGEAQALSQWIEGIARARDLEGTHFALMGPGVERHSLMSQAKSLELHNVSFPEPVSSLEYARLATDADALIVSLSDAPIFTITIPSKIQTSLAMGCAVLGTVNGDAAAVLTESGAGLVSPPQDVVGIESLIRRAVAEGRAGLEARGNLGRQYYLREMSEQKGTAILVETLTEVAELNRRSA